MLFHAPFTSKESSTNSSKKVYALTIKEIMAVGEFYAVAAKRTQLEGSERERTALWYYTIKLEN
ncbi:hypothetical protein H2248_003595 [Termitomyces sp. 'cryptogamus']|nr:hypothetical protein H2248_003595 [Termitomyces sp. 'cryptogamus']